MEERRVLTKSEKREIYARYAGKCAICGMPVKYKNITIDHKMPRCKGGTNDMSNLQLACWRCNQFKQAMTEWEFAKKLAEILFNTLRNILKSQFEML